MLRSFIECKIRWAEKFEKYTSSILLLAIRLYMANIFWKSGMLKLDTYLNDNWDFTLMLFEDEHPVRLRPDLAESWGIDPVQLLSPEVAAPLATAGELALPVLLAFGLFGRFGALGLLFMTAVIQFTYKDLAEHEMWALLLFVPLVFGAGKISIDHYIKRWFTK